MLVETEKPPKTVLELLTHRNPPVHHPKPRSSTLTKGLNYHYPREVKEWRDFKFEVLEEIYGGSLLRAARQKRNRMGAYPAIYPDIHCEIKGEPDTRSLYEKWTQSIVMAASIPIMAHFHPAIWKPGDVIKREDSEAPPERGVKRIQPTRRCSDNSRKPRKQSLSRLQADSGSSILVQEPPGTDPIDAGTSSERKILRPERFPKEYKTASKWKSQWLWEYGLIDGNGKWGDGQESDDYAWPIRQAYSYCIQHLCRYGCILTCHEAFIFRVSPRDESLRNCQKNPLQDLEHSLIHNGRMEYVSIPWAAHRKVGTQDHNNWTVNLALWFVHVLAGNQYRAEWSYDPLHREVLVNSSTQDKPDSSDTIVYGNDDAQSSGTEEATEVEATPEAAPGPTISPFSQKRKRESEEQDDENEDRIHRSFAEY